MSTVDTSISIDTKGRRQPAKKAKAQPETEPPAVPRPDVVTADGDRGVTLPEQRRIYDKGSLAGRAECVIEELDAFSTRPSASRSARHRSLRRASDDQGQRVHRAGAAEASGR